MHFKQSSGPADKVMGGHGRGVHALSQPSCQANGTDKREKNGPAFSASVDRPKAGNGRVTTVATNNGRTHQRGLWVLTKQGPEPGASCAAASATTTITTSYFNHYHHDSTRSKRSMTVLEAVEAVGWFCCNNYASFSAERQEKVL